MRNVCGPSLVLHYLECRCLTVDAATARCGSAAILLILFVEVVDPLLAAQKIHFSAARQEEDQVVRRPCLLRLRRKIWAFIKTLKGIYSVTTRVMSRQQKLVTKLMGVMGHPTWPASFSTKITPCRAGSTRGRARGVWKPRCRWSRRQRPARARPPTRRSELQRRWSEARTLLRGSKFCRGEIPEKRIKYRARFNKTKKRCKWKRNR